ncbi:HWE histidine kinase domain-containing protein, partial [uncultured Phenylobacterium sp.]|uniref:sensor histidine kinase n=1 Tax=uncultured Phenylobacterium sp. TaxID=349273 RepID=UPI0025F98B80
MASYDWSSTPLGPSEAWSQDLMDAVERMSVRARPGARDLVGGEAKVRATGVGDLGLFNAMDQAFCTIELAFDATGRASDYRFVEVNQAFERQTGIVNGEGRWMREIAPDQDEHWFEVYGRVAVTGEAARFENYSTPLGRWWSVFAFKIGEPEARRVALLFNDITDRKLTEAALRESEEDYRYSTELNPQVAWTAGIDGLLDRVAPRWKAWTGSSGLGSSYADALHPDDVQRTSAAWGHSVATGAPYDIVHRVRHLDGDYRWIRSRAYPRRDEEGAIVRWYGSTEDIHLQKTAEDRLKVLVLELNHRVKNNLTTVQSIALQTFRASPGDSDALEAFLQRITALAAAHDILTREHWEAAGVADVARGVLDALSGAGSRIRLAGPLIRLRPGVALSLSMAFHELGTNALKYGALSVPNGWVDLEWSVDAAAGD